MKASKNTYRILSFCLLLIAAWPAFAQNLQKKITIDVHDKPLGDVIKLVSKKGDILFSYNPQTIPVNKKVTLVAHDLPLSDIFDKLFKTNEIEYTVVEKQVILKPAGQAVAPMVEIPQKQARKFTISGFVREKTTGEAIIGANVYDAASMQGTTTNAYGFYSITLPESNYLITESYVGYKSLSQQVSLNRNIEATIELELLPVVMKTVEISGDPDKSLYLINKSGEIHITPSLLKQIPGFAGNVDVIKSLQNVPGIVTFGDGSSFYYVRGGNNDQNLLLIDEAPIYNPSHLFGFFSALSPEAIKDVMIYKGDYPSNYGGRLSSVVDVKAKEGNLKRVGLSGNVGPYTSDLTVEGPIIKEKSSFLLSGRISNLNWLKLTNDPQRTYKFNFYDLNAKFNIQLNTKNRLFLTGYAGSDVFERYNLSNSNTFGISWNNTAGTLRWNHIFNSNLFSNTTAYYSKYNYYLDIAKELKNYWTSSISNLALKTDFSWYPNPKNTLKAGFEISGHKSNPGNLHYTDTEIQRNVPHNSEYQSVELGIYAGNEQQIGTKFYARYGLRLTSWNDFGPSSVYFFNGNHTVIDTIQVAKNTTYSNFLNLEPRISLRFAVSENASLHVNYSHNVQNLQVLSNSTSPFTSLEVWVPSGPNIKPQQADQVSAGFFSKAIHRQLDFAVEGYYKWMYNQVDYVDHANLLFNPLLEGELRFGKAWSYGIETMVRKSQGKFTGWISYAYSRCFKEIQDVNQGNIYPASYDRPNNFCVNVSYATGKHWSFSSHWMYLTGAPFTSPTGFYYVNGTSVPVYGSKNNDRFPDYHRLDLSVAFALSKPGNWFQHNLVITVYNVYGRHNPFEQNFNKIMDDNGNFVVPANLQGDVERIPTAVSVAGAIPSLNYTFRF